MGRTNDVGEPLLAPGRKLGKMVGMDGVAWASMIEDWEGELFGTTAKTRRAVRRVGWIIAWLVTLAACGRRPVEWDQDPQALIVQYYSPYTTAGLAGAYDPNYYIPEIRVWGDGRVVWVEDSGNARQVLAGQLSEGDMQQLVQTIVDTGFFDWEAGYQELGGNSFPPMHLQVNLSDRSHEVSEHGGAPAEFYMLVDQLTAGAGVEGQPLEPAAGYLTVRLWGTAGDAPQWPGDALGLTLDQVGQGCTLEGDLLVFAWEQVNANPTAPVYVQSGGQLASIMVQAPGVSYTEPPAAPSCE